MFDIRPLLAGIWILLFGMHIFEDSIKYLWGNKMKSILQKYTNSSFSSIFTGTRATALLQSSSLVTLLLLAFVWAWVMHLSNAIWVIIGANIGTTVSSLLVARLGFGEFKISVIAMPLIAIWGISLVFLENKKYIARAKLLLGFGFLFLGLSFMKESVEAIKETFDLAQYAWVDLWVFGLIWIIITIIIQSSSAVWLITLVALSDGIIDFPASIAIVMWSNIGTTLTWVIASLWWGNTAKRQLALAQVLFNIFSGVIWVVFFRQYIWLTNDVLGFADRPVMWNAVLNAIFNTSTSLIFLVPAILYKFTHIVKRIIPDRKKDEHLVELASDRLSISEDKTVEITRWLADQAFRKDSDTLLSAVSQYLRDIRKDAHDNDAHHELYDQNHELAQRIMNNMKEHPKDIATGTYQKSILLMLWAMKHIKNIRHNLLALKEETGELQELKKSLKKSVDHITDIVGSIISTQYTTDNIEEIVNSLSEAKDIYNKTLNKLIDGNAYGEHPALDTPSLINLSRELYESNTDMILATSYLHLDAEEREMLERVK